MRIEVTALRQGGQGSGVGFRCAVGVGSGRFVSETPPVVGGGYDVEVDVELEAARDVRVGREGTAGLLVDRDRVVLNGLLVVYPDGAVYLDVAGSTVSVDLPDDVHLSVESGSWVELSASWASVTLHPYDL